MNMPYLVTLVVLDYEPEQWFSGPRDIFNIEGQDDFYSRYGKMHFIYGQPLEPALNALGPNPRVLVIVRPGELELKNPVHQIYRPDGQAVLWLCEL
jgi:hypothetical protein